jgi:hypothetical protein
MGAAGKRSDYCNLLSKAQYGGRDRVSERTAACPPPDNATMNQLLRETN